MNPIIKEQLQKCKCPNIPDFDDNTQELIIPKSKVQADVPIIVGNTYIIKLEDYIVNPYDGFTLHNDWNNGIIPTSRYMKVTIMQMMGKMIKISGDNYNHESKCVVPGKWCGWIPTKSMKIIDIN